MIAGGYALEVYCDGDHANDPKPKEFFSGRDDEEAFSRARAKGWALDFREGKAYCPKCARAHTKKS